MVGKQFSVFLTSFFILATIIGGADDILLVLVLLPGSGSFVFVSGAVLMRLGVRTVGVTVPILVQRIIHLQF